jgi:hypothetical protein
MGLGAPVGQSDATISRADLSDYQGGFPRITHQPIAEPDQRCLDPYFDQSFDPSPGAESSLCTHSVGRTGVRTPTVLSAPPLFRRFCDGVPTAWLRFEAGFTDEALGSSGIP